MSSCRCSAWSGVQHAAELRGCAGTHQSCTGLLCSLRLCARLPRVQHCATVSPPCPPPPSGSQRANSHHPACHGWHAAMAWPVQGGVLLAMAAARARTHLRLRAGLRLDGAARGCACCLLPPEAVHVSLEGLTDAVCSRQAGGALCACTKCAPGAHTVPSARPSPSSGLARTRTARRWRQARKQPRAGANGLHGRLGAQWLLVLLVLLLLLCNTPARWWQLLLASMVVFLCRVTAARARARAKRVHTHRRACRRCSSGSTGAPPSLAATTAALAAPAAAGDPPAACTTRALEATRLPAAPRPAWLLQPRLWVLLRRHALPRARQHRCQRGTSCALSPTPTCQQSWPCAEMVRTLACGPCYALMVAAARKLSNA